MNKEMIEKILEAAIRAPSGDNVQPWRFEVANNFTRINLFNLPEKDDSYYNFDQAASHIAHGAVLENIIIAAQHLGCVVNFKLFPYQEKPDFVAQIDLSKTNPSLEPLYPEIFKRHTNRFHYKSINVTTEIVAVFEKSIAHIDQTKINLEVNKSKIDKLATILKSNDRIVFENKYIHKFLFDKIRWNKEQVEETRDGMPLDTLGLNPLEKIFFPLFRSWNSVKIGNLFGLSKIIELKCWWNIRCASLLGMVIVEGNEKFSFIQGGRAMQRVWLEATRQGLELQPIIGLPLLINRSHRDPLNGLSIKHKKVVSYADKMLSEEFNLSSSETIIMGFRVGKGSRVDSETKRRKVALLN